ncbi:short-chain dehydrogenase/reductase 1-like [Bidens hawaiensis]|uniref:short-chain dehydrogenase/reductase 1-like n=1 Tax=Bidens hawaiensis TaxID=980011 RepID=UPI00404980BD
MAPVLEEKTDVASTKRRVAVVTGGHRGIGLEICRQLASNGITVVLASITESLGLEATKNLKDSGLVDVVSHQLDVTDPVSIDRLIKFVESQFKKVDILVNNVGVNGVTLNKDGLEAYKNNGGNNQKQVLEDSLDAINKVMSQPYNAGEECIKTNYYGNKAVTEAFLPLLQLSNSPRIVNISSDRGELQWISNEMVKAELSDIDNLTEEKMDGIIQRFLRDFKADKLSENGWPLMLAAYTVSKIAVSTYTRLLARKYDNILVNCVHPGYCKTDLSSFTGYLTPEEGAKAPVMVALLPDDGPSGVYFSQMEIAPF